MAVANNRQKVPSMKFNFYDQDVAPILDTVKTAVTGGNTLVKINLAVDNTAIWMPDDVLSFQGETIIKAYSGETELKNIPLAAYVHEVNHSAGTITIVPLNGKVNASNLQTFNDNIPVGTEIVRLGNSINETDILTTPMVFTPTKDFNYCQRQMLQVERSKVDQMAYKDHGLIWGLNDDLDMAVENYRATSSARLLLNPRAMIDKGRDGKARYFTGGLLQFGIDSIDLTAMNSGNAASNATWAKIGRQIFEGNGGSAQRTLFCGGQFMEYIAQFESVQKQLDAKNTEIKFGITFNRVNTSFGELIIVRDPLLNECGRGKDAYWIDLENIGERYFEDEKQKSIDMEEKAIRKTDAIVLEKTAGLSLRYAKTHGYIYGPTSTSFYQA
jgi:hypothetical protein